MEDKEKNKLEFKLKLSNIQTEGKTWIEHLRKIDNIIKFYKSAKELFKFYSDSLKWHKKLHVMQNMTKTQNINF